MIYRNLLLIMVFAFSGTVAEAQFRESVPSAHSQTRLYASSSKVSAILNRIFNPSVFQMSHSFEMSTGSFAGHGYSMGMYTNTMAWTFSSKLAARMDVSVAYSPQNRIARQAGFGQQPPRVFLRNAELAWKPSERVRIHFQVRQNPYPYGMGYSPYGYGLRHPGFSARNLWF